MFERNIAFIRTDDPGPEEPVATRDRLKGRFPPGSVRRMTQLGMLVGSLLNEVSDLSETPIVYASEFGETRALEGYLESFPNPSPTLFQTSIHPSGVQQGMIARQQAAAQFLPIAGSPTMIGQAVLAALLTRAPRVVLCGGEERGTWLLPHHACSERTFAFLLVVTSEPASGAAGRLRLSPTDAPVHALPASAWFNLLQGRQAFSDAILPGWNLELSWNVDA